MPPSIFIHAKNVFLHQLPQESASISQEFEISGGAPADRCEGGASDCGPVAHYDTEGVPLCQRCWDALAVDKSEVRDLGNGEKITQKQLLAELAELGPGWRLEKPHELFAQVDYGYKNQHGAYTRDETLKDGYYWTSQETPWFEGGRVVVGFDSGYVSYDGVNDRAFARAVRVSGQ